MGSIYNNYFQMVGSLHRKDILTGLLQMPGPTNNAFIYLVSQLEASCMLGKNGLLAEGAARLIHYMVTPSQKFSDRSNKIT